MTDEERIETAKAYVALSNAHGVELIRGMLEPDAEYRSANVGSFVGVDAIVAMMDGFFAAHPDVHWTVDAYRARAPGRVEFDFEMTATDAATGAAVRRRGTEVIGFSPAGRIARIEVGPPRVRN